MDTKGICILVANDDRTCKSIVSEMLQHCNYQVLHVGSVLDVLNAIWESKDDLDLVLTNAHKLEANGAMIVQHIQKKLNLPVILMCADKLKIMSKGQAFSFAAYVLKGLSRGDVNSIWQFALKKEKAKSCESSSAIAGASWFNQKRKRMKEPSQEKKGGDEDDSPVAKKMRVVWTREMHQKFLEAIEIIGYEKAVPKKIVEVMGIQGLTRENVASHLQKFRGSTKRTQERNIGGCYAPDQVQLTSDFRTYGDQMRNSVLKMGNNNNTCANYYNSELKSRKFVGYRLTSDGNSIEFGNIEASVADNISTEKTHVSVQAGDANNEKCLSVHEQDISIQSTTEEPGNYFPAPNSMEFAQMAQSFDDFLDEAMMEGAENKCCPWDWEEIDDVLFEHDD